MGTEESLCEPLRPLPGSGHDLSAGAADAHPSGSRQLAGWAPQVTQGTN